MDRCINLTLPVYWVNEKKTKPSTTHLIGMNFYRNAHHFSQNNMKKFVSTIVKSQLATDIQGATKYKVKYTYFYKSKVSDLMNVVSLSSKILNDALQEAGVVVNDTVAHCIEETAIVGSYDKDNPRVEVEITIL